MHILIDSGSYHCLNVGDVAMLQAGIQRLQASCPTATFAAVTNAPDALARHCPGVEPIPVAGRVALLSDRFLGRADRLLPRRARGVLQTAHQRIRDAWPAGLSSVIAMKRALALRPDYDVARLYINALHRADLVVVTGAGVLTDSFLENATGVLATLGFAQQRNIATALMGQGIGPVSDQTLLRLMAHVLPRARLIALRERCESARLLDAIGVAPDRIAVTGDDAIEMAHGNAPLHLGDAIGVNVRVAPYAGIDGGPLDLIRSALRQAAARASAELLAIPIAHHPDCHDGVAIRAVLSPGEGLVPELETPAKAIAAVSRCRVVMTASYHAAVFALAQGIPVVGVAATAYYRNKFAGLGDLFPGGCEIVPLDAPDARARLESAIASAWTNAPRLRDSLLRAAVAQVEQGRGAYQRLAWVAAVAPARPAEAAGAMTLL